MFRPARFIESNKVNLMRFKPDDFELEKEKLVNSKLQDFNLDQKYFLTSLVLANDSVRSKYVEQIISHALTPMNYIGEGDVCDIWLSFADLKKGLKGEPVSDSGVYKKEFQCMSIENGFGIEVKCTRSNAFDVEPKQGFFIPKKNEKGFIVEKRNRWSDFYIFVKFRDDAPKLDTTKGPFYNYSNYDIPEDSIEEIYLVPTFMLSSEFKEETRKIGGKDGTLHDFITKKFVINRRKLKQFVSPLQLPDLREPESINTTIRNAIAKNLIRYRNEFYDYRKKLDDVKSPKKEVVE